MTVSDYLDWRGDLNFLQSPFNEIDQLILCLISYVDYEDLVPEEAAGAVTLAQISDALFRRHPESYYENQVSLTRLTPFLLKKAAQTARFASLRLFAYVNEIDDVNPTQFSAVSFLFPDRRHIFLAYRGTDETITGWQENFNLCYLRSVPAQHRAHAYFLHIAAQNAPHSRCRYLLGGHSKGGNLAAFAAFTAPARLRKKILAVYENDAPGFSAEIIRSAAYQELKARIFAFCPENSIVGRLFNFEGHQNIIKSAAKNLWEHDGLSWEVLGASFVRAQSFSVNSDCFHEGFHTWLQAIPPDRRAEYIDGFFDILRLGRIHKLEDIEKLTGKERRALLRQLRTDSPLVRRELLALLRAYLAAKAARRDSLRRAASRQEE